MNFKKEHINDFLEKLKAAKSEADVRFAWGALIDQTLHIGTGLHQEIDYRDLSFDNVVIEFKDKGLFNNNESSAKFIEATKGRILKYVERWSKESNMPTSEFIGIATDGDTFTLVKVLNDKIVTGNLLHVNESTAAYVLDAIDQNKRLPLTADNLIDSFGVNSKFGRPILDNLFKTLITDLNEDGVNRTKLFFNEWKSLYGQVATMADWKRSSILASLGFPQDSDLSQVLFVENTYNSLLVKFIAAELVSTLEIASSTNFSESFVQLPVDKVLSTVYSDLELNGYFESANIHNFVSEVLFSWYATSENSSRSLAFSIKQMATQIALYDMTQHQAMQSGDLLKQFYQNLIPDELRKSLGEFYTPDWLVDYMLSRLPQKITTETILDPTNGSGSFLLRTIELKKKYYSKMGLLPAQQIEKITHQVYGFDLNPLAVQTARVNYLFALADLLQKTPGYELEIPVLLADAIYAPEPQKDTGIYTYSIGSSLANLSVEIPASLVNNQHFLRQAFVIMNRGINRDQPFDNIWDTLANITHLKGDITAKAALEKTYDQITHLHQQSWDGIWLQIIQNFFWSVELPKFDIVVGNPPWVRWSSLPQLYQDRVKETADKYDIFSTHKRYGGNELDISALLTFTVSDKWLKDQGVLMFLLPQNHLQNDSSSGFRQFKIGKKFLAPLFVEDLKKISIFSDVTNKPMIFCAVKQESPAKYPVNYIEWESVNNKKKVDPNVKLTSILHSRITSSYQARPLKKSTRSPWIYGSIKDLDLFDTVLGESTYIGRKGITTDLNGVFFPRIIQESNDLIQIQTRPDAGRIDIGPTRKFWIEKDLVYPLAKGSGNIQKGQFISDNSLVALVPNSGILDKDYAAAQSHMDNLPKTERYFEEYMPLLSNRSTYRKFMSGAPYWAVYNVGAYTFSRYKVAWSEMGNDVKAAILLTDENPHHLVNETVIPDHKLFFCSFTDMSSAAFFCGLLNSEIISTIISHSTVSTSRGDILKHLHLPLFDATLETHRQLAALVVNQSLKQNQHELNSLVLNILHEFSKIDQA